MIKPKKNEILKQNNSTFSKTSNVSEDKTFSGLNNNKYKKNNNNNNNETPLLVSQFNYLNLKENSVFNFEYKKNIFNKEINCSKLSNLNFSFLICIDLDEDSPANSVELQKTLENVILNIENCSSINLSIERCFFMIFFKNILRENNFNLFFGNNLNNNNNNKIFGSTLKYYSSILSENIEIILFNFQFNFDILFPFLNKNSKDFFYLLNIEAGTTFKKKDDLKNLIINQQTNKKLNILTIPKIETLLNEKEENLFSKIENYENFMYNLYNINYNSISISIPLNNKVFLMYVDYKIYSLITKKFLLENEFKDENNYNNRHSLPIYLSKNGLNVIYSSDVICEYKRHLITFDQMMNNYIEKTQDDFKSLIDLKNFVFDCQTKGMFFKKIICLLRIFGKIIMIFFPSISTLFLYCVFYEGFRTMNKEKEPFCFSVANLVLIVVILFYGFLIENKKNYDKNKINEIQLSNSFTFLGIFLFYFSSLFCLFCFIISILAVHYIDKNKPKVNYKMNKLACVLIIIINFIFAIIPILLYLKSFSKKIIQSFLYLFFHSAGYNNMFNNIAIITAFNNKNFHPIFLFFYVIFNSLMLCFGYLLNSRKNRCNFVLTISIIFTVYNCMKIIFIVVNIFNNENEEDEEDEKEKKKKISKKKEEVSNKNSSNNNYEEEDEENEEDESYKNKKKNQKKFNNNNNNNNENEEEEDEENYSKENKKENGKNNFRKSNGKKNYNEDDNEEEEDNNNNNNNNNDDDNNNNNNEENNNNNDYDDNDSKSVKKETNQKENDENNNNNEDENEKNSDDE